MGIAELALIAAGVSMDAFAVSVCKGLSVRNPGARHYCSAALWFGGFQAMMPLAGYFLGVRFAGFVYDVDHWIAFVLLGIIGGKMIREALAGEDFKEDPDFSFRTMLALAVATSIDALAIGVSFAFLQVDIWKAIALIGAATAAFSAGGIYVGNMFGSRYKSKAELAGGVVLVVMGVKILVEHLFFQ